METVAYIVSAGLLATWVWVGVQVVFCVIHKQTRQKRLASIAVALSAVGVFSFFAPSCASVVPPTIEWPVGLAGNVCTASNGDRIVAHSDSSRVQVYDSNWRFQRAIPVDLRGGTMHMSLIANDNIEVYSYRARRRTVFTRDGTQIYSDSGPMNPTYGPNHITFGPWVPTWPWLFSLTTPFAGWSLAIAALAVGVASGKVKVNLPRFSEKS